MRIVLFGPPGAGKGTQARLLSERHQLSHISTGTLLRAAIQEETAVGIEAKDYVEHGKLVPGPLVRKLAEDAVAAHGYENFILDGYPRTVEQASWLSAFLNEHKTPLSAVITLRVPDDLIVDRLSKRRVHRETGENYHLEFKPPPPDIDPEKIYQRSDDQPVAIQKRLDIYHAQTEPVESYYAERKALIEADGVGDIEAVYQRLEEILRSTSNNGNGFAS